MLLLALGMQGGNVLAGASDPTVEVSRALSSSDARLLGLLMDDMITISIKHKVNIYSKSQAQKVVNDFFKAEKNAVFKLEKYGNDPRAQAYYGIGTYKTNGRTYIVYYLLKYNASQGEYLLKELKID